MAAVQASDPTYASWSLPTVQTIATPTTTGVARNNRNDDKILTGVLAFAAAAVALMCGAVILRSVIGEPKPRKAGTKHAEATGGLSGAVPGAPHGGRVERAVIELEEKGAGRHV